MPYRFPSTIIETQPPRRYFFLTVPTDISDEIDHRSRGTQGGFGSVKVIASIGSSSWSTSLFPSTQHEAYILLVNRAVRDAEGCGDGDRVTVSISLVGLD